MRGDAAATRRSCDASLLEMQDALAVACDQALVMGGDEHGDADLVEGDEDLEDAGGRFGVEIGGRLVGDQERGPVHHRARDREALLLATGELDRVRALAPKQPDLVERRAHAPRRLDRKSTRLNSSHTVISYAVFCLKKKKN